MCETLDNLDAQLLSKRNFDIIIWITYRDEKCFEQMLQRDNVISRSFFYIVVYTLCREIY